MHSQAAQGEEAAASERRSSVDREPSSSIEEMRERCRRLLSGSKISSIALAWIVAAAASAAAPGAEVRFCHRRGLGYRTATLLYAHPRACWRDGPKHRAWGRFPPSSLPPRSSSLLYFCGDGGGGAVRWGKGGGGERVGKARLTGEDDVAGIQHLHVPVLLQWYLHRQTQQRGVERYLPGVHKDLFPQSPTPHQTHAHPIPKE